MTRTASRRPEVVRLAIVLSLLLATCGALAEGFAQGQGEGRALYERGDFERAYERTVPLADGEAQLLASRAAVAQALYVARSADDQLIWLERARAAAEEAMALSPDDPAMPLALAHARGEIALRTDVLANLNTAGELRDLMEAALALDPEDGRALVALGVWHLQLSELGVGWLYGGRREEALPLIERGVEAAPERIDLRLEYAGALRVLGEPEEAREQLRVALALPATTAVERYQQDRAAERLRELGG